MTLEMLVRNCPKNRTLRAAVQAAVDAQEAKDGPCIVRYYRYDKSTNTLYDETFHISMPLGGA